MNSELFQKIYDKFFNLIIFVPILSYFAGFYLNENSVGTGDYAVDSDWIKKNIQIFY